MASTDCLTMTVEEAARVLGISRNSAFRAVRTGQLPAIRIGRRLLVPRAELSALLGVDPDEPESARPYPA